MLQSSRKAILAVHTFISFMHQNDVQHCHARDENNEEDCEEEEEAVDDEDTEENSIH